MPSRGRRHVVPVALLTATVAGSFVVREAGASEVSPEVAANTRSASAVAGMGLSPDADAVAAAAAGRSSAGASRSDQRAAVVPAVAAAATVSNASDASDADESQSQALAEQRERVAKTADAARQELLARSKARAAAKSAAKAKATADRKARVARADEQKKAKAALAFERKKANARVSAHRWVAPLAGYSLTSGFGYRWGKMHPAQDLARPVGGSVHSLSTGTVVYAGWDDTGYGNLVRIEYWDGTVSWMAHNSQVLVTVGQSVAPGQVVAHSGNTGQSTGPHVHLEIHPSGGAAVPPLPWLAQRGIRL